MTDALTCTEDGKPVVRRRKAKRAPFKAPDRDVETVVTGIRAYPCGKCSYPVQLGEVEVYPDSSQQIPIGPFGCTTQPAAYRIFTEKPGPHLCASRTLLS